MFSDLVNEDSIIKSLKKEITETNENLKKSEIDLMRNIISCDDKYEMLIGIATMINEYQQLHSDAENAEILTSDMKELPDDISELNSDKLELQTRLEQYRQCNSTLKQKDFLLAGDMSTMRDIIDEYKSRHDKDVNDKIMKDVNQLYIEHLKKRFELDNVEIKITDIEII